MSLFSMMNDSLTGSGPMTPSSAPSSSPSSSYADKDGFRATFSYYVYQVWDDQGDTRMLHYPFMSSGPWATLTAVGCYLLFVKVLGPNLMRNRPPLIMKDLMVGYNLVMVLLSGYMFYEGAVFLNFGLNTWGCMRPEYLNGHTDPETLRFLFIAWLFFFSKLIEFSDTIFMVLRKKHHQISNLHVIHHSIVPISVWLGIKFSPAGSNAWFPLLNSAVHTLMYSYFGLSALGSSAPPSAQVALKWFKPWMTRLQMGQFCLAIAHCVFAAMQTECTIPFPQTFLILNLGNAFLFLCLFFNFYRSCYRKGHQGPHRITIDKRKGPSPSSEPMETTDGKVKGH